MARGKAPKRRLFWLEWAKDIHRWVLIEQRKGQVDIWARRADALPGARAYMRHFRRQPDRPLLQLRIRTKDGRVASEATYGADPKRYKG